MQLRDRAAQLVKHLDNRDVSGPDGKDIILKALERAPLIMQLDKHRVDEHWQCCERVDGDPSLALPQPPGRHGFRLRDGRDVLRASRLR